MVTQATKKAFGWPGMKGLTIVKDMRFKILCYVFHGVHVHFYCQAHSLALLF